MLLSSIFSRGCLLRPREIEVHVLGDKLRWLPKRQALFLSERMEIYTQVLQ